MKEKGMKVYQVARADLFCNGSLEDFGNIKILQVYIKKEVDKEIERLGNIILESGLWNDGSEPGCCLCGYVGPGFYDSNRHKCVAKSQALKEKT